MMLLSKSSARNAAKYINFSKYQIGGCMKKQLFLAHFSENLQSVTNHKRNLHFYEILDLAVEYAPKDILTDDSNQHLSPTHDLITKTLQQARKIILSEKPASSEELNELSKAFTDGIQDLDINNVGEVVWSIANLKLLKGSLADSIQSFLLDNFHRVSQSQQAIIMWSLNKAGINDPELWKTITKNIDITSNIPQKELARIAWSLAKQRIYLDRVWDPIEIEIHKWIHDAKSSENLVIFIWSFALAGKGTKRLWDGFEQAIEQLFDNINTNSLIAYLWSYAYRNIPPFKIDRIEKNIMQQNNLDLHELASFLYCFTKLGIGSHEIKHFLTDQIRVVLNEQGEIKVSLPTISLLVYSFGKINMMSDEVWQLVEKRILDSKNQLSQLDKEHLLMLVDGVCRTKRLKGQLRGLVEKLALQMIHNGDEKSTSSILWSFSSNDSGSNEFWNEVKRFAIENVVSLPISNVSTLFWALVKTDQLEPQISNQIREVLSLKIDQLSGDDLRHLFWCLGRTPIDELSKELTRKLKRKVVKGIELDPKDLHLAAYSLARIDDDDPIVETEFWTVLNRIFLKELPKLNEDAFVFLSAVIGKQKDKFSSEVLLDYDNYCSKILKNFKSHSVAKIGLGLVRYHEQFPKIWKEIALVFQERHSDLVNLEFIGELLAKMVESNVGGPKFINQLDEWNTACLENASKKIFFKIMHVYIESKQGSPEFWNACMARSKVILEQENLNGDELYLIAMNLANRKKGDNSIWNLLEDKIAATFESIHPNRVARLASLYSLKHGLNPKLWRSLIEHVKNHVDSIQIRPLGILYSNMQKNFEIRQKEKHLVRALIENKLLKNSGQFAQNLHEFSKMENIASAFESDFKIKLEKAMSDLLVSEEGKLLDNALKTRMQTDFKTFEKNMQTGLNQRKPQKQQIFFKLDRKTNVSSK